MHIYTYAGPVTTVHEFPPPSCNWCICLYLKPSCSCLLRYLLPVSAVLTAALQLTFSECNANRYPLVLLGIHEPRRSRITSKHYLKAPTQKDTVVNALKIAERSKEHQEGCTTPCLVPNQVVHQSHKGFCPKCRSCTGVIKVSALNFNLGIQII